MNLKQKLIEIRKEVKQLQKTKKAYGYKYVSEDKVLGVIRDKMDELGVLLEMKVVSTERLEVFVYMNNKNKEVKENVVKGDLEFVWADAESDEERVIPFGLFGQQQDTSQAFGSGLTYSNRYFLLKYFQIATNESDPDKLRSDIKKNDKAQGAMTTITATEFEALDLTGESLAKTIAKYSVKKWLDLSDVEATEIINSVYKLMVNKAFDKEENKPYKLEILNYVASKLDNMSWAETTINTKIEYDDIINLIVPELQRLKGGK